MSVVLGIDGGGTRTRAVLVGAERNAAATPDLDASHRVLARAEAGSIKRLRVGAEAAEANLRSLLREILHRAGASRLDAACVGVASASMPGVAEWIGKTLAEFGIAKWEVVGDEVIALDAAFRGGPGILQIAGTGTNCMGRTATGERESAGGWSSVLGDEGSGYWIGLHAVRNALHALDRREPTGILDAVGQAWGTTTLEELVDLGNRIPGPDFSLLAPVVARCAEQADPVAVAVLRQAATDLADSVLLVRHKLRTYRGLAEEVPVAWIGGVLENIAPVRERFLRLLAQAAPSMPVAANAVVAEQGAVWRALRLAAFGKMPYPDARYRGA